MNQFERLDEVRDVARARAKEDFEYFANHVMGARIPEEFCVQVQRAAERGASHPSFAQFEMQEHVRRRAENAYSAWVALLGGGEMRSFTPTETFSWLFGQEAA